jgi:hypothetical protein
METIIIFFVLAVAVGLLLRGGSSSSSQPPVVIVQIPHESGGLGCLPAVLIILFALFLLVLARAN